MKKSLILFLLNSMILLTPLAKALDVTATNGSAVAIQAAVNNVSSAGGGNVYIPAGTWYWNGETVTIPGGVNVIGASYAGCMGHENNWTSYTATTILHNDAVPSPSYNVPGMFYVDGTNGKQTRISGIQFETVGPPNYSSEWPVQSNSAIHLEQAKNFRIDHCTFLNFSGFGVSSSALSYVYTSPSGLVSAYGLVDHCYFDLPYKLNTEPTGNGWLAGYGVDALGNMRQDEYNWIDNTSLFAGKYSAIPNASLIIIEDCHFSRWRHAIDGANGGVMVPRFCLFDNEAQYGNNGYNIGDADAHGGGGNWGTMTATELLEAYNNTFIGSSNMGYVALRSRGGHFLIYNNTYTSPWYNTNAYQQCMIFLDQDSSTPPTYAINQSYAWNNSYVNCTYIYNAANRTENVDYFLRAPNQTLDGWTYTPYPYPHPLTLEGTTYYSLTGKLVDKSNNPVQATIISYQNGTNNMIDWAQTNSSGYYSLQFPNGTYDVQFNLTNFFISGYSIKLNSINVTNDTFDLIQSITGNQSSNTVSIVLDVNDSQSMQIYSTNAPSTIRKNGTYISNISSLSQLAKNTWFYQSPNLYLMVSPEFTVTAKSGSAEDIQAAVNQVVAAGGGVVYIPAGNFTFNTTTQNAPYWEQGGGYLGVNVTVPAGGLQIIGAGINVTNLIEWDYPESEISSTFFTVTGTNYPTDTTHGQFRMSGISFFGKTNVSSVTADNGIKIQACYNYRIDHCSFWNMGDNGINVYDHFILYPILGGSSPNYTLGDSLVSQGVIDHCQFYYMYKPACTAAGYGYGYGVGVGILSTAPTCPWNPNVWQSFGNATWHTVIEDCYFTGNRHAVASSGGGMYVFRFNDIEGAGMAEHVLTGHPGRSGEVLGMRSYEIYNNTINGEPDWYGGDTARGPWWKSGSGIYANNTLENLQFGIDLCNSDANSTECPIAYALDATTEGGNGLWIWGNTLINTSTLYNIQAGYDGAPAPVLDTNFFLHAPNATQATYTPIPYPDPLTLNP